jgi:hypothetical protein
MKKNLFHEEERSITWPDDYFRHPLKDGQHRWASYLEAALSTGRSHTVLLEFVKDGTLSKAKEDAATLLDWVRL